MYGARVWCPSQEDRSGRAPLLQPAPSQDPSAAASSQLSIIRELPHSRSKFNWNWSEDPNSTCTFYDDDAGLGHDQYPALTIAFHTRVRLLRFLIVRRKTVSGSSSKESPGPPSTGSNIRLSVAVSGPTKFMSAGGRPGTEDLVRVVKNSRDCVGVRVVFGSFDSQPPPPSTFMFKVTFTVDDDADDEDSHFICTSFVSKSTTIGSEFPCREDPSAPPPA